jgi:hypothetical protein
MHTKNEEKKIPRKVNVICVPKVMPMPLPSISVKKMLLFVVCLKLYSENLY